MVSELIRRSVRGSRSRAGVGAGGGTRVGAGTGVAVGAGVDVGSGVAVGTGVGAGPLPQPVKARAARSTAAATSSRVTGMCVVIVGLPYARGLATGRIGVGGWEWQMGGGVGVLVWESVQKRVRIIRDELGMDGDEGVLTGRWRFDEGKSEFAASKVPTRLRHQYP